MQRRLRTRWPTSLTQLRQSCQGEWAQIPEDSYEKLVEAHPKHLAQVMQFKGNATKYY